MGTPMQDPKPENPGKRPVKKRNLDWIVAVSRSLGFVIVDTQGQDFEVERDGGIGIADFLEKIRKNSNDAQVVEDLLNRACKVGQLAGLITDRDCNEVKTHEQKLALLNLAAARAHRNAEFRTYNKMLKESEVEGVPCDAETFQYRAAELARAFLNHVDALGDKNVCHEPGDQGAMDQERHIAYCLAHELLNNDKQKQREFEKLASGMDWIRRAREIIDAIVDSEGRAREVERIGGIEIADYLDKIRKSLNGSEVAGLVERARAAGIRTGLVTDRDWDEAKTDEQKVALLSLGATRAKRDAAFRSYNELLKLSEGKGIPPDTDTFRYLAAELARAFLDHADALGDEHVRHEPGDQRAIEHERQIACCLAQELLKDNEEQYSAFDNLPRGAEKIKRAREIINAKQGQ